MAPRRRRRRALFAPLAAAAAAALLVASRRDAGSAGCLQPCGSRQHRLDVLRLRADPLERLGRVVGGKLGGQNPAAQKARDAAGGAVGAVGGAVLGGLLLGPFGAVFGANLGARWNAGGSQEKAEKAAEGLDKDMVLLAQQVARELAEALENAERVESVRIDNAERAARLQAESKAKYDEATEALKRDDEPEARAALEARQRIVPRLEVAIADLERSERQIAALRGAIPRLEDRAREVARLLARAQVASGSERTALAAEASGFQVRDPLLDKFDALERS
mmetsp:Transcript_52148/g.149472  ORF Transcript_52148/g.149472 Transcript_52148/m.149472 type:complete len:279 (-) Transcript_52148:104-940(-)